jgi:hypothetical protein
MAAHAWTYGNMVSSARRMWGFSTGAGAGRIGGEQDDDHSSFRNTCRARGEEQLEELNLIEMIDDEIKLSPLRLEPSL